MRRGLEVLGGWILIAFAGLIGCGGQVDGGGSAEPDPDAMTPTPSDQEPRPGPNGNDPLNDPTSLGECTPGFKQSAEPGRACAWLAKGLCYDEKLEACACICPMGMSTCSSGFDNGPDGQVRVSCY